MNMATDDASTAPASSSEGSPTSPVILLLAWIAVGAPLLWGVLQTFKKALALFAG
jgi:hypothetical protein